MNIWPWRASKECATIVGADNLRNIRRVALSKDYCSAEDFFENIFKVLPLHKRIYYWFWRKPGQIKWFFLHRFHPRYQYNIVRTGLPPGYYDTDKRMETAIIKLFVDFIEIEKPFDQFDTDNPKYCTPEQIANWAEIKELYHYFRHADRWMHDRELDWNDIEGSKKRNAEFTEKLCSVVKLRGYYWT